jgi:hypothetical protein
MKANDLAQKAALNFGKLSNDKEAALDPATIITFLQLILSLVGQFKDCGKNPAAVVASSKNPGLFQKILLRRAIRDDLGNKEFRQHGNDIIDALLATGKDVTEADVVELYKEV